jgi:hypothetical protein
VKTHHVLVLCAEVEREREGDGAAQAREPQHDLHPHRNLDLALCEMMKQVMALVVSSDEDESSAETKAY